MIISRTPFRISLFGGGTDHPAWFRNHGGAVVGMAINKYCYLSVRRLPPFFDHRSRIVYSQVELVNNVAEIRHPAVRGILSDLRIDEGLEIHHHGDLPARSGLGSSSSFTVGLLNALHAFGGKMATSRQLASEAIRVEQDVLKETVGCQDQIWAAYGGFNRIDFKSDGGFEVSPIIISSERRNQFIGLMMMFFTGFSRFSSDFASEQLKNIGQREPQLSGIQSLADEASEILSDPTAPLERLGNMLHESWRLKRELADTVSNNHIDEIYAAGRSAGAIGGKLLGAGGGGFIVFLVEPHNREALRQRLKHLVHVSIDMEAEGSKIVVYQPDGL